MSIKTNWYAITGSPCSGKSTVIKHLAALGYATTPEFARLLIDAGIKQGKNININNVRVDEAEFQKRVLETKIAFENKIPPEKIVFIDDGGIPSSIAYYQIVGLDPASVIKESKERKYKGVFLLEPLPYQKDYARVEDEATSRQLGHLLYQAYLSLGYKVVRVPVNSVEARVQFILSKIDL